MTRTEKILLTLTTTVVIFCAFMLWMNNIQQTYGSVSLANEYKSTTTATMNGSGATTARTQISIQSGESVLGSVVVSSTTNATFKIWNATSTTDIASTTALTFSASPANGTYTYDVSLTRGLILEFPSGFLGSYTITFR